MSQNTSQNSSSKVREVAYNLYQKIDLLATKYTKRPRLKQFVDFIVRPYIKDMILNKVPEEELKQILIDCHNEIGGISDNITIAKEIVEARKLNNPKTQNFVENIKAYKDALELIPDGL